MNRICKLSKVSIFLLFIALFIFSWGNSISYANNVEENNEVSALFINFINEAYSDMDKFRVINQDREDVTDYFINKTRVLFETKDYKAIQEIIINERLVPSTETTIVNKNNNDLMRASRTQYCYDIISHSYNLQGQVQYWEVILGGTIVYNPNNGEIYSASNAGVSLYDDSGINQQLSARIISASTGYNIQSSKVQFYATYSMEARVNGFIDGMDLVKYQSVSLGTHNVQFYGYPE